MREHMDVRLIPREAFFQHFGEAALDRAIYSFTPPTDTWVILTLLASVQPKRILEIGTALGHMTANFSEWSPDDAVVFTIGSVQDVPAETAPAQYYETPDRATFGSFANHFGKIAKVCFVIADSLYYDFTRIGPFDFVFVDGAHDEAHVLSDTLKVYRELNAGGWLVWHDFDSLAPWAEVRQALTRLQFAEPIYHVAGTHVAFLQKRAPRGYCPSIRDPRRGPGLA
jgi:predicted O-methyltransferase YrrM